VLGLSIFGLALAEGLISLSLLAVDLASAPSLPEKQKHSQYDRELGWVSVPNVYLRDMYGPGVWLQTNAQGFRANRSFLREPPPGMVRVVCSGDSFTLGFGVSNDETWCQRLNDLDPRIEPVNMGQSGYGLGQAYLWYRREEPKLVHDIHVFAFIWNDFARMTLRTFNGYHKPVMTVRNGELQVENVPVPHSSYARPVLTSWLLRTRQTLSDLRIGELGRRMRARLGDDERATNLMAQRTWEVAEKIFDALAEHHRKNGSLLVLLHLPSAEDTKYAAAQQWDAWLRAYARLKGVPYVDLGPALRQLPMDSAAAIFGTHLHYAREGNAWVARELYDRLLRTPEIERRLNAVAEPIPAKGQVPSSSQLRGNTGLGPAH
jgi:hypothetical protein